MAEEDGDLLLALALSQATYEDETKKDSEKGPKVTAVDSTPKPTSSDGGKPPKSADSGTSSPVASERKGRKTGLTVAFDQLVAALKKDTPFVADIRAATGPINVALDNWEKLDGDEQFYVIKVVELFTAVTIASIGSDAASILSVAGNTANIVAFFQRYISVAARVFETKEDAKPALLQSLLVTLELIFCADKPLPGPGRWRKDFTLAAPALAGLVYDKDAQEVQNSVEKREGAESDTSALVNRLLIIKPVAVEDTSMAALSNTSKRKSGVVPKLTSVLTRVTLAEQLVGVFGDELKGGARLLDAGLKRLSSQQSPESVSLLQSTLDFLLVGKIPLTDESLPVLAALAGHLVALFEHEQAAVAPTSTPPLSRALFEDTVELAGRHPNRLFHRNLEVALASRVFLAGGHLTALLAEPDRVTTFEGALKSDIFTWALLTLHTTLSAGGYENLKFAGTVGGELKLSAADAFNLLEPYSGIQRIQRILSKDTMDVLMSLLLVAVVKMASTPEVASTPAKAEPATPAVVPAPPPPPGTSATPAPPAPPPMPEAPSKTATWRSRQPSESAETPKEKKEEQTEEADDMWFANLFSDDTRSDAARATGPRKSVAFTVEAPTSGDLTKFARVVVAVLDGQVFAGSSPQVVEHVQKLLNSAHLNVIVEVSRRLSAGYLSPSGKAIAVDSGLTLAFRMLCQSLTTHNVLTSTMLDGMLARVWVREATWPLVLPSETLVLVTRVLLACHARGDTDSSSRIWHGVLNHLEETITGSATVPLDTLQVEHTQLLMFLFHLQPQPQRKQIVEHLQKLLVKISALGGSFPALAVARAISMFDYILHHFNSAPKYIIAQVESNLTRPPRATSLAFYPSDIEVLNKEVVKTLLDERPTGVPEYPIFYDLRSKEAQPVATQVMDILHENDYNAFYGAVQNLLKVAPNGTSSPRDAILGDYTMSLTWKLLGALPPSLAFVAEFAKTSLFEQEPSLKTLHYLRWLGLFTSDDGKVKDKLPAAPSGFAVDAHLMALTKLLKALAIDANLLRSNQLVVDAIVGFLASQTAPAADGEDEAEKPSPQKGGQAKKKPAANAKRSARKGKDDESKSRFSADVKRFLASSGNDLADACLRLILANADLVRLNLVEFLSTFYGSVNANCLKLMLGAGVNRARVASVMAKLESSAKNVSVADCLSWSDLKPVPSGVLDYKSFRAPAEQVLETTILHHLMRSNSQSGIQGAYRTMTSLMTLLGNFISTDSEEGRKALETPELLHTTMRLLDVVLDATFEFIKPQTKSLMEKFVSSQDQLLNLADLCKLERLDRLFKAFRESHGAPSGSLVPAFTVVESILVDCVGYYDDLSKCSRSNNLRVYFLGVDGDTSPNYPPNVIPPKGNFSEVLLLPLHLKSEAVNLKVLSYVSALLELGGGGAPTAALRRHVTSVLQALPTSTIAEWLQEKLLGYTNAVDDGSPASVSGLKIRSQLAKVLRQLLDVDVDTPVFPGWLFDILLGFINTAFSKWSAVVKDYFDLLKELAVFHNRLVPLVDAVVKLLSVHATSSKGTKGKTDAEEAPAGLSMEAVRSLSEFLADLLHFFHSLGSSLSATPRGDRANIASSPKTPLNAALPAFKARGGMDTVQVDDAEATEITEPDVFLTGDDGDDASQDGDAVPSAELGTEAALVTPSGDMSQACCTYTKTGSNFTEQHWYYCYTCSLTFSEGCCSVCAQVCHKGHDLSYSRQSRFFCDCGAGAVRGVTCLALQPRAAEKEAAQVPAESPVASPASATNMKAFPEVEVTKEDLAIDAALRMAFDARETLFGLLKQAKFAELTESIYESLLGDLRLQRVPVQKAVEETIVEDLFSTEKKYVVKTDLMNLKTSMNAGSYECKLRQDGPAARDLKQALNQQAVSRNGCVSNSKGWLALAEGPHVNLIDEFGLAEKELANPLDKSALTGMSRATVPFEVLSMNFNPENECFLAVAGLRDAQVVTFSPKGVVVDQLQIELSLEVFGNSVFIVDLLWVPNSQVRLAVVTNQWVKIYDLSKDKISPTHYFTMNGIDTIRGATLVADADGQSTLLLITVGGHIFQQTVFDESDGAEYFVTETVQVPESLRGKSGSSLYYSSSLRLVFASYEDGKSFAGRLDSTKSSLTGFPLVDTKGDKKAQVPLYNWTEIPDRQGWVFAIARKAAAVVAFVITSDEVRVQSVKGAASKVEGLASLRLRSPNAVPGVVTIWEDGSLHVFHYVLTEKKDEAKEEKKPAPKKTKDEPVVEGATSSVVMPATSSDEATQTVFDKLLAVKKDKRQKAKSKELAKAERKDGKNGFPIDFFEHCINIFNDVTLGGDMTGVAPPDVIKQRLRNMDEYVVSPNMDSLKFVVRQSNPDLVMVGLRLLLGHNHLHHIPTEVRIFNRVIKMQESTRRWYDIPFTDEEAVSAQSEFTFVCGASFVPGNAPLLDSMEVYAKTKKSFGWSSKATGVGASADVAVIAKVPETPLEHAAAADLRALEQYYLAAIGPAQLKDDNVRGLFLKSFPAVLNDFSLSAIHGPVKDALAAMQPSSSEYYELKDDAQLLHVETGLSELESSKSIDATLLERHIKVVRKIASSRQAHFAKFLSTHPNLVTRLLALFWKAVNQKRVTFGSLEDLVSGLTEVVFAYAVHANAAGGALDAMRPVFAQLQELVLASHEVVRAVAGRTLASMCKGTARRGAPRALQMGGEVTTYSCDGCGAHPITVRRWHCSVCDDFDLCDKCHASPVAKGAHLADHTMNEIPLEDKSKESAEAAEERRKVMSSIGREVPAILRSGRPVKGDVSRHLLALMLESLSAIKSHSASDAIPFMQVLYTLASSLTRDARDEKTKALLAYMVVCVTEEITSADFSTRNNGSDVATLLTMVLTLLLKERDAYRRSRNARGGVTTPSTSTATASHVVDELVELLRSRGLVPFIFERLEVTWKSLKTRKTEGPSQQRSGALLKPSHERAAFSLLPFVSDSYVKAHPDVFDRSQEVFVESVLRLAQCLFVGANPAAESGPSDPLYERKWYDLLCEVIFTQQTQFARNEAKRLLRTIAGNLPRYYEVLDEFRFGHEAQKVLSSKVLSSKTALGYDDIVALISAFSSILDVAVLRPSNWQAYCVKNPDMIAFLRKCVFVVPDEAVLIALRLLTLAFVVEDALRAAPEPTAVATVASTATAPAAAKEEPKAEPVFVDDDGKPKKKKRANDAEREKERAELVARMEKELKERKASAGSSGAVARGVGILTPTSKVKAGAKNAVPVDGFYENLELKSFVEKYLFDSNLSEVRAEAKNLCHWLYHRSSSAQRESMFSLAASRLSSAPSYGKNAADYTELLAFLVSEADMSRHDAILPTFVEDLVKTLGSQNSLVANHPNSHVYRTLADLVEFEGFFLESDPCLVCNDPEVPFNVCALDTVKMEQKFTDKEHIIKCGSSLDIQSIIVKISELRRSRMIRTINVYYTTKAADMSELRSKRSLWKQSKSFNVPVNATEASVEFPIPITAFNLKFEYDDCHDNLSALASERLQCPRCSRPVHDRHGICSHCGENAYQCRQCRNINYENLEAFLCNECGFCKYARFDYTLVARASFAADRVESEEDYKKSLAVIDRESENAHRRYQQVMSLKKPLGKLIGTYADQEVDKDSDLMMAYSGGAPANMKVNKKIGAMGQLYAKECKTAFDSLSKSVQVLLGTRRELVRYLRRGQTETRDIYARPPNTCFGCATAFVSQCLSVLEELAAKPKARDMLVKGGVVPELVNNNLHQGNRAVRSHTRRVICAMSNDSLEATECLNDLLRIKLDFCLSNSRAMDISNVLRDEMLLLAETCGMEDSQWESRLRQALDLFFAAIECGSTSPVITEQIILPCLRIVTSVCKPALPPSAAAEQAPVVPAAATTGVAKTAPDTPSTTVPTVSAVTAPPKTADGGDKLATIVASSGRPVSYPAWLRGESSFHAWKGKAPTVAVEPSATFWGADAKAATHARYLADKYSRRWMNRARISREQPLSDALTQGSWIQRLLLNVASQAVRKETAALLESLAIGNRAATFMSMCAQLLGHCGAVGDAAEELFELFKKLTATRETKLFMVARGFLKQLCTFIGAEVKRICNLESNFTTDIAQGYVLKFFTETLVQLVEIPVVRARFKKEKLVIQILDAFLSLRGIVVQKTKLTDDAANALSDLIAKLNSESTQDTQNYMAACIKALDHHRVGRTPIFIFEQLCQIVCPVRPDPEYLVCLNKSPTQEEFIRGQMTKNPYSSKEVGPLMRDVKRKICTDLDMISLMEDDNGLELLVHNQIIDLSLPVGGVFEKVWKRACQQLERVGTDGTFPPMPIVYRLQGLDGDATERRVDSVDSGEEAAQDPEEQYKITSVMAECGGLETMVLRLTEIIDSEPNKQEVKLILKLLIHCLKIRVNRAKGLQDNVIDKLLECLQRVFPIESLADLVEDLLLVIEAIVLEATRSGTSMSTSGATVSEASATMQMQLFLERLSSPVVRSNKKLTVTMTRIMPVITYGQEKAMQMLVDYFLPHMDFASYDATKDASEQLVLESLVSLALSISLDASGEKLKRVFLDRGCTARAIQYLKVNFVLPTSSGVRTKAPDEWIPKVMLPSLQYVIRFLTGIAKGHASTQQLIGDEGIFVITHLLESMAEEEAQVGPMAEDLLEACIFNNEGTATTIKALRDATKEEKRRLAMAKRNAILSSMNMKTTSGDIIEAKPQKLKGMEEIEEEKGFTCMVCREGYTYKPEEVLCFYTMTRRVNLAQEDGLSRPEQGYQTMTQFSIIHASCHRTAAQADRRHKQPKEEWDGASLRNNHTPCNNLMPMYGPKVTEEAYLSNVERYWTNLANIQRIEGSKLRLMLHDLRILLQRFADEKSFSENGGRESNMKMIPYMIEQGLALMDHKGTPGQRRALEKSLCTFLTDAAARWLQSSQVSDNAAYYLVCSLLVMSLEEWQAARVTFLKRLLVHGYVRTQALAASSASTSGESAAAPAAAGSGHFGSCRSAVILFAVVDGMHKVLKIPSGKAVDAKFKNIAHVPEDTWVEAMRTKLRSGEESMIDEFLGLLSTYKDEYLSIDSFQEFFDVLEVLSDVLNEAPSADEWVAGALRDARIL